MIGILEVEVKEDVVLGYFMRVFYYENYRLFDVYLYYFEKKFFCKIFRVKFFNK